MNIPELVTFTEATRHLRVVSADDYPDVQTKLQMVSAVIWDYLKQSTVPDTWIVTDSSPETMRADVSEILRLAIILALSEVWENRESSTANILSPAVKDILHRLRDPALA